MHQGVKLLVTWIVGAVALHAVYLCGALSKEAKASGGASSVDTAETDRQQRVRVDLALGAAPVAIADGPFVVTHMSYPLYENNGSVTALYTVPKGASCGSWDPRSSVPDAPGPVIARIQTISGIVIGAPITLNLFVRAHETLCGVTGGSPTGIPNNSVTSVSGYRTY
jgi:hypothetical protein